MVEKVLRVETKIDNKDAKVGLDDLQKMCVDAKKSITDIAKSLNLKTNPITIVDKDGLKAAEKEIDAIGKKIKAIQKENNKKINKIGNTVGITGAQAEEQSIKILQQEKEQLSQLREKQRQLTDAVNEYKTKQAEATAEKQRQVELAKAQKEAENTQKADIKSVNTEISDSGKVNAFMEKIKSAEDYDRALKSVKSRMQEIESQTARLSAEKGIDSADALKANKEYQLLKQKLDALTSTTKKYKSTAKSSFSQASDAAKSMGNSIKSCIKTMTKYTLAIFGARSAFFAVKNAIRGAVSENEQLNNTVTAIKGVLSYALTPVIERVVYYIQYALAYLNLFIKTMTGVDLVAGYNAKALKKQAEATKETAKATKDANSQLAAFDEKNMLSSNKSSKDDNQSKAATLDLPDVSGGKFEKICKTIKAKIKEIESIAGVSLMAVGFILLACGQIPMGIAALIAGVALTAAAVGNWDKLSTQTQAMITAIMEIAGGAFLAIGLILVATGVKMPLGVAMIAAGAAMMIAAVALNWSDMPDKIKTVVSLIMAIVGMAFLAIGAILAFSKVNIPLGIALMALGAVSLATTVALNWEYIKENVKTVVSIIAGILGAASLVIGAVLALSGAHLPLGIALIALGAAAIVTAIALNWNDMSDKTKTIILTITAIVSAALLVFGAILTFSGANLPLGIALLVLGAAGLVASIALMWNLLSDKVKNTISIIAAIASAALLVLGIVLCATGVNLPLGIALIAAGAVGLVTVATLNKDVVKNWVSGAWSSVKSFWNSSIRPIFTTEWWKNKLMAIANGAKAALNTAISYVERAINWMIGKINLVSFRVADWVPGIGGTTIGFNLPTISIPRLARGGIVNNPGKGQHIIAGEAGAEAILPLQNNTEWMDILAEKVAERMSTPIINKFVVDGKEVFTQYNKNQKRYNLATNGGVL